MKNAILIGATLGVLSIIAKRQILKINAAALKQYMS